MLEYTCEDDIVIIETLENSMTVNMEKIKVMANAEEKKQ